MIKTKGLNVIEMYSLNKKILEVFSYGKRIFPSHNEWWEEFGIRADYIENADNVSYIVTDVTPIPNKLSLDIECVFLNDVTSAPFGCRPTETASTSSNNIFQVNNNIRVDLLGDASLTIPKENNIPYKITYSGENNIFSINGKVYSGSRSKSDIEVIHPFAIFANNSGGILSVGSACVMRYNKFNINDKQYIPIQVKKQFADLNGVIHNIGDWIMVNGLIYKDVPTHIGTFSGKQLLDGRYPVMDGLTHWWDSESQSGTTWTPRIGNVNISTSDSWEDGYFKKLPNNKCETSQFNVNWSSGCTVDILYNQLAFPITGADSQLWSLNNQSNQEWALHYTSGKRSSFYSPTLFSNSPRYGDNLIPLNMFTSDVFTYDGNTKFNNYIDSKITTFGSGNTVTNNRPGAVRFALKRITSGTNNQTSLVKSIRIYNRELTPDEIENNRLYDLKILNKSIDTELEWFETTPNNTGIRTNFIPTNITAPITKVELMCSFTSGSTGYLVNGIGGGPTLYIGMNPSTKLAYGNLTIDSSISYNLNYDTYYKLTIDYASKTISVNDVVVASNVTLFSFSRDDRNFGLNCYVHTVTDGIINNWGQKTKYCKIYVDDVLTHHWVGKFNSGKVDVYDKIKNVYLGDLGLIDGAENIIAGELNKASYNSV